MSLSVQQLGGVRRDSSARDDIQVRMFSTRNNHIVDSQTGFRQIVRQTSFLRQAEALGDSRFADIEAHQSHFLAQDSQREGGIGRDIRFTFAVDARGHQYDGRLDFRRQHETQVRTDEAEQLGRNRRFAFMNSDMFMTRVLDDLSQDRGFEATLEIFLVINLIVEQDHQIQQSGRYHHTQEQTDNTQRTQFR